MKKKYVFTEHDKEKHKEWLKNNPEMVRKESHEYRVAHIEKINKYMDIYRKTHKEELSAWRKNYRKTHRSQINEWRRKNKAKKWKEDPRFRLDTILSNSIRKCLHGVKGFRSWQDLVGYTVEELMVHLENGFTPQMSWDNYGSYWDVDHKKPQSLFHYVNPEEQEFKDCWGLGNLQPMEHIENVRKSNHYTEGV
jgi:hypothetical protein